MWGFGGGGGGGNPWLQGLASRIGAARGGGQRGGGQGGFGGGGGGERQPMFGLGGMFSRMGQGWGGGPSVGGGAAQGGGMPSWGQHQQMGVPGSPNSMSFAPQQQGFQQGAAEGGGERMKINPEMGQHGLENNWNWGGPGGNEQDAPNTFRATGGTERRGGQSLKKDENED